jgi:[ribosomal protein S5]-alanine N-acetyltransferase
MSDPFDLAAPPLAAAGFALRPLAAGDAPDVFAYASDPEVARHTLWPPHASEAFTRGFLERFTAPTFLSWAIVGPDGSRVVGMVFLHTLNRDHRRAEIGFNLARSQWGRGMATEASRLVLGFSFPRLDLNRVEATCMPANAGARRVAEKLGTTHEGTLRRSHLRHDRFHDMDLFGLLRADFKG